MFGILSIRNKLGAMSNDELVILVVSPVRKTAVAQSATKDRKVHSVFLFVMEFLAKPY